MILTENARKRLRWIDETYQKPTRLVVRSGGCAGFKYHFDLGDGEADDLVIDDLLRIDPASAAILDGAVIDFVEGYDGAYFSVDIPDATSQCGCGASFHKAA